MQTKTQRSFLLDNCKFFLILLVVLGHGFEVVGGKHIDLLYQLIYLFHMPAFVFISGYIAKFSRKAKIGELFLQYIVFQVLYFAFSTTVLEKEQSFNLFKPYWILWFLLALMIWRLLLPYAANKPVVFILSVAAAVTIGLDTDYGYYLSFSRAIVLFPFFLAGYHVQEKHLDALRSKISPALGALAFVASLLLLYIVEIPTKQLLFHSTAYEKMSLLPWEGVLWRAVILLWATGLLLAFLCMVPAGQMFYSKLGERTLQVYILHGFALRYLQYRNFSALVVSPAEKILFFTLLLAGSCVLLLKPFSYLFKPISSVSRLISTHR